MLGCQLDYIVECFSIGVLYSILFDCNILQGPVHAYVAMPDGKTSYLAELESGMRVLIVDAYGRQRTAVVGRVKIESRPLILVEAVVGFFPYSIFIYICANI